MHAQEGTGAAVGRVLLSGRSAFSALKRADIPSFLVAAIIGAPLVAALGMGLATGAGETWSHILSTKLTTYTVTTLGVMALVAALILAIAVPLAWLMTMYQFPGR
ncbi:MAG: hypothetical protein AAFQ85_08135, partial [Pseudomonadota bacterium]